MSRSEGEILSTFSSRAVSSALRVLAAIALLALLAYGVDWQSMPRYLTQLSWPPALLAVLGLTLQFAVNAWKWQWALRIHGLQFRLGYLLRAYGIGFFFNNFLPSGIGGDAYRVMSTWPKDGFGSRAVAAVLIERIIGFAALLMIGNLGAFALLWVAPNRLALGFILVSLAGAVVVVGVACAVHLGWHAALVERVRHTKAFAAITHNIGYLRRARRQWLPLIAISLLFQVLAIVIIHLLFLAVGTQVPFAICAVIGAVAGFATVIPISINGLGVVEGSFAGAAVALGVEYEPALVVAVLIRLAVLPATIVFGVLYAVGSGRGAESAGGAPDLLRSSESR